MTQIKNDTYFYKVILHLVDHGHDVILEGHIWGIGAMYSREEISD